MRYPEGHKEAVRARIVTAAAKVLRQKGLAGVSIPSLMKRAGLTHGGFYGHFGGRDDLVAEAVRAAAEQGSALGDDARPLHAALDKYLSAGHLAHPEEGCVLAALGTEATRQSAVVQRSFAGVAVGFLRKLERKLHPRADAGTLSDDTLALAATMIGALVLGRLVRDEALAARILAAARATAPASRV